MADFIIVAVILLIVGAAIAYILKEKKRGIKCIGCPSAAQCAQNHNAITGCNACTANGGCSGGCSGCTNG